MFLRKRINIAALLALGVGAAVTTSVLMPQTAMAQSSEGTVFGAGKAGATVTIVNLDTGATRTGQVDASGNFVFSKVQPGRYRISSEGRSQEISVAIGSGTQVSLAAQQLEQVVVSGRRIRSMIDVSTTEVNSVFTAEQINALPVNRTVNSVALLAPGVVKGDSGLGDGTLPSFGGASVAENGYYINGFDVTNIRNFLSYADLPFEAISQQQVKSGGYGAEYGRSLGGVISMSTKRGTNAWKLGGATYFEPEALRSKGQNVLNKDPDANKDANGNFRQGYTYFARDDKANFLEYNLYGGGPIIKDKLFIFALLEGKKNSTTNFAQNQATKEVSDKPNGMVKIDFAPTDALSLEYTGITNKERVKISDFANAVDYQTSLNGAAGKSVQTSGGDVHIFKANGYLTDKLTVSALVGRVDTQLAKTTGARTAGANCPVVLDVNLDEIGCWTGPFPGLGGRSADARPFDSDKRTAARLDVEWVLGNHTIKAGVDNQKFVSYEGGGSSYTGGYYYRYFVVPSSGLINGVGGFTPGTQFVRRRTLTSTSGEFEVLNDAYYIEDSWKVTKNVLLYGGLRSESFDNRNGDGVSFVKKDNLIAPRLGASWDVNGDASLKVYANAGRYYIPVASNTNIRATRGERFVQEFFTFPGRDPVTQAPTSLNQTGSGIGTPQIVSDGSLPNPATIADTGLKPMNQDEFIVGFQKALTKEWNVGAKVVRRKINDGMDDFCGHYALEDYAAAKGYTNAFATVPYASCVLVNPGRDVTLAMDLNGTGNLVTETIPASYFRLAPYKRVYSAIELSIEKPFDGKWGFNASYTWSKSKGSAEGYVQSDLQQEDAGITQDFDFGSFTDGANGYLPNDRRHVFKFFGNYAVTESVRLGANAIVSSGRPKSCVGFVPSTVYDYSESRNYTSASSYYCLNDNGVSELRQRGTAGRTPWTAQIDLQFAYTPKLASGKLTLTADVFNVLNTQKATAVNQNRDYSRADLGKLNPNYGNPIAFQDPRSVRLTARYEF